MAFENNEDVKALMEPAIAHRLIIKTSSSIHDVQPAQVIRELLEATSVGAVREAPVGGIKDANAPAGASTAAS